MTNPPNLLIPPSEVNKTAEHQEIFSKMQKELKNTLMRAINQDEAFSTGKIFIGKNLARRIAEVEGADLAEIHQTDERKIRSIILRSGAKLCTNIGGHYYLQSMGDGKDLEPYLRLEHKNSLFTSEHST